jgi:hypothetical protein
VLSTFNLVVDAPVTVVVDATVVTAVAGDEPVIESTPTIYEECDGCLLIGLNCSN